jgi:monofunctional biosynthetic peptidoglycan transglycosylase
VTPPPNKPTRFSSTLAVLWRGSIRVAAVVLVSTAVLSLLLRCLPPPTTAFMLRQRLSGVAVDYRWLPLENIAPHAALAVIASEDQRFFDHWGIDLDAIATAIEENRTRQHPRGASTITQQVVKNLYLWPGRSYVRKGIEVYFTLLTELLWSKRRIVEVYLNIAEMGPGVYGVEAAGRRFFRTPADRLTPYEAALLAAVLPSPRRMHADRPSEYLNRRARQIIRQMNALGGTGFLERRLAE